MDSTTLQHINEFKKRIEKLDEGYTSNSFLRTILSIVHDDSRAFDLKDVTPVFQFEVAKLVEEQAPMTLVLMVGDDSYEMVSGFIPPGETVQVVFKGKQILLPLQFAFKLQIPNHPHVESGMLYLRPILDTPVVRGGLRDKSKGSVKKIVNFVYDFYSDETYKVFAANHLPDMSVVFEVQHDDGDEHVQLQSLRLIIHYNATEIRRAVPPGYASVYNVSRAPYKTVTILPQSEAELLPLDRARVVEKELLDYARNLNVKAPLGFYGTTMHVNDEHMTVAWGEISDLAIATTLQKLTADVPGALDDPQYIVSVLERSDQRGRDLLDALVRVYGSPEKISTLRQFMMHTSGMVESMPESFFKGILDTMAAATSFMTNTTLFKSLPVFVSEDERLETELVVMLNTLELIDRALPGVPFVLNTKGNTRYDYAILAMMIKRIAGAGPGVTAQDVIAKTLRLKSSLFWNPQVSRDGNALEEGPYTIHTLSTMFSTLATLGIFVESLARDSAIVTAQTIDRALDSSFHLVEKAGPSFRTMVWQGINALENPIPILFRTSGNTVVYMAPHLGLHGVISVGHDPIASSFLSVPLVLAAGIFDRLSAVASFVEHVALESVPEIVELGLGQVVKTTRDIVEEAAGQPSLINILPQVQLKAPFASVTLNGPETVTYIPTLGSKSRVDVVREGGNIESQLVIDYSTGNIHRMGARVDAESDVRIIDPTPINADHTVYHGKDMVYYADPQASLPILSQITSNIQQFHSRLHNTPVSNMVQPGMDAKRIVPLAQQTAKRPFEQLPIQHCHGKKHHTSYYHSKSQLPYSQY